MEIPEKFWSKSFQTTFCKFERTREEIFVEMYESLKTFLKNSVRLSENLSKVFLKIFSTKAHMEISGSLEEFLKQFPKKIMEFLKIF